MILLKKIIILIYSQVYNQIYQNKKSFNKNIFLKIKINNSMKIIKKI
jgi:hypothetical protein